MAASDHDDWAAMLEAVRLIHGRIVVTRRALEDLLDSSAATSLPPLVHAIQAVRQVISSREVDSLPPNELHARMHAVLQALDRELKAMLLPLDEPPTPEDFKVGAQQGAQDVR